uniref:NikA, BACTERIAL CONJUGATION, RELAXASE, DNA n=1 Tax=Siphoviridae sp. ctdHi7 TaxID=2825577 RepID=A0A8S5U1X8_9CAUD|nr:MAG TPA: NikA, BACTERIAL CONJUGATION, RELAXASE, DNA [Siphoviridae sp. ctdHi7]
MGLNLKITEAENDLLNKCVSETGRSKTDIVVKGIALVYKELQRK